MVARTQADLSESQFAHLQNGPKIVLILWGRPEEQIMHVQSLKQARHLVTLHQVRPVPLLVVIANPPANPPTPHGSLPQPLPHTPALGVRGHQL